MFLVFGQKCKEKISVDDVFTSLELELELGH